MHSLPENDSLSTPATLLGTFGPSLNNQLGASFGRLFLGRFVILQIHHVVTHFIGLVPLSRGTYKNGQWRNQWSSSEETFCTGADFKFGATAHKTLSKWLVHLGLWRGKQTIIAR